MPRQLPQPSFDIVRRTKGQSAVEQAAYNAREELHDIRQDKTFAEHVTREDLVASGIMAKDFTQEGRQVQDWVFDRETLWNKAEACENVNGQPARKGMIPLPRELTTEQNIALLEDYLQETFVDHGMVADWAVHKVEASDGKENLHAHVLLSMRELEGGNFSRKKNRDWNKKSSLNYWRDNWEKKANEHLDQAGSEEQVTIQSYQAQGLNKLPGIHLGERAWTLEQQGIVTKQGRYNARVAHHNQIRQAVDGLGLARPQSRLAGGQTLLAGGRQSALSSQHHDQPLPPHKQRHFQAVRQAVQGLQADTPPQQVKPYRDRLEIDAQREKDATVPAQPEDENNRLLARYLGKDDTSQGQAQGDGNEWER